MKTLGNYQTENKFGNACGLILAKALGYPRPQRIVHPMQWTRVVDEKQKRSKDSSTDSEDEESKGGELHE